MIISKSSFFQDKTIPRNWVIGAFGLKVIIGVILTLIYSKYYTDRSTSDIFKYFDDSKILFNTFESNPIDFCKMMIGLDSDIEYFTTNY
ncbi:MAG: hypothetical protein QMB65_06225, partial [Vicingaceae bacterium]